MQTRPRKYKEPTRNTAFTIPLDVIDELEKLCKQHKIESRSEFITKLIHQAYLQYNDPILSVQRMKERKKEIEEERKELDKDCIGLYGRTLEDQEGYLLELELQKNNEELRVHEEALRTQEIQQKRDLLVREKRPMIQATLTEFFKSNHPKGKKPFIEALKEKQLIDVWRFMDPHLRDNVLTRAHADAGWHQDSCGRWQQITPRDIPGYQ